MPVIITLIICILVSFLFSLLAKKLRFSVVIGLIVAGILIGSSLFKNIILGPNTEFILDLGEIGLISLMFLAGMEVSWRMLNKEKKDAVFVAFFAALVPFLLGFVVFLALGFSLFASLTIGICMSITAEATKARVLLELNKLKTKLGSLMMDAGIIDDILGICLFAFICYWFTGTFVTKELIILFGALLAFFVGIFVRKFTGGEGRSISYLEKFLLIFVIPFFFIAMGIHFSLQSLTLSPLFLILIIIIAVTGKILGTLIAKPFTKLRLKQLYLVGWGMNSRGAIELALALIAFRIGLVNISIYSSLVIMALVTTLIFPFFVKRMVEKEPNIME